MDALRIRFHYVYAAISHNKRTAVGAGRERRRVHGSAWNGRRRADAKGSNNKKTTTQEADRAGSEISEGTAHTASAGAGLHIMQQHENAHTSKHVGHSADISTCGTVSNSVAAAR